MSDESFGRAMTRLRYKGDRDSTGLRRRFWLGVRLTGKYIEILSGTQVMAQGSLDGFSRL